MYQTKPDLSPSKIFILEKNQNELKHQQQEIYKRLNQMLIFFFLFVFLSAAFFKSYSSEILNENNNDCKFEVEKRDNLDLKLNELSKEIKNLKTEAENIKNKHKDFAVKLELENFDKKINTIFLEIAANAKKNEKKLMKQIKILQKANSEFGDKYEENKVEIRSIRNNISENAKIEKFGLEKFKMQTNNSFLEMSSLLQRLEGDFKKEINILRKENENFLENKKNKKIFEKNTNDTLAEITLKFRQLELSLKKEIINNIAKQNEYFWEKKKKNSFDDEILLLKEENKKTFENNNINILNEMTSKFQKFEENIKKEINVLQKEILEKNKNNISGEMTSKLLIVEENLKRQINVLKKENEDFLEKKKKLLDNEIALLKRENQEIFEKSKNYSIDIKLIKDNFENINKSFNLALFNIINEINQKNDEIESSKIDFENFKQETNIIINDFIPSLVFHFTNLNHMYPEDVIMYRNISHALHSKILLQKGKPKGAYSKNNNLNLGIGDPNKGDGFLVHVPNEYNVLWLQAEIKQTLIVHIKSLDKNDFSEMQTHICSIEKDLEIAPDGSIFDSFNYVWCPIPLYNDGDHMIYGDASSHNWIAGIAFSRNLWNHASISHEITILYKNSKRIELKIPVVPSDEDKILYFILPQLFSYDYLFDIYVNDIILARPKFSFSNPFATHYINSNFKFMATIIPKKIINSKDKFVKVELDIVGKSSYVEFKEIGTFDEYL